MRARQFDVVTHLADRIKNECQPWLRETQNLSVTAYRGLKKAGMDLDRNGYRVASIRQDRKPSDTPLAVHEYYNETIQKAGKVANRSNSLFVTSNKSALLYDPDMFGDFNEVVVTIPMGEFNYTWSTLFKDAFHYYEKNARLYFNIMDNTFSPPSGLTDKLVNSWQGDDGTLMRGLRSLGEVMIHAEEAFYIKRQLYAKVKKVLREQE